MRAEDQRFVVEWFQPGKVIVSARGIRITARPGVWDRVMACPAEGLSFDVAARLLAGCSERGADRAYRMHPVRPAPAPAPYVPPADLVAARDAARLAWTTARECLREVTDRVERRERDLDLALRALNAHAAAHFPEVYGPSY